MKRAPVIGACLGLAATFLLMSCAAPVKQPRLSDGLVHDYTRLEKVSAGHLQWSGTTLANYRHVIVEKPLIRYQPGEDDDQFSEEELTELMAFIQDSLTEELGRSSQIVLTDELGPGVARLQLAVTDLDASTGALNVSFVTKATGAGLGGIASEFVLQDSVSGEEMLAAVRWGNGSRVLRAGFTRLGDAKIQVKRWARQLRADLEGSLP